MTMEWGNSKAKHCASDYAISCNYQWPDRLSVFIDENITDVANSLRPPLQDQSPLIVTMDTRILFLVTLVT